MKSCSEYLYSVKLTFRFISIVLKGTSLAKNGKQVAEEIRRKPGLRNKTEKSVVFLEISPKI
jgi:hypothetical protein